jgi:hypothetical protein
MTDLVFLGWSVGVFLIGILAGWVARPASLIDVSTRGAIGRRGAPSR